MDNYLLLSDFGHHRNLHRYFEYVFFCLLLLIRIPPALIAVRIWRSQRILREARIQSNLIPLMVTLVESGALYAAALLSVIVTYATKNNAQYIVLDLVRSFQLGFPI